MGTVILTGASDGIGRAMAVAFARRGWKLGLIARRTPLLEDVAAACRQAGSPDVRIETVDVTDSARLRAALAGLDDALGGATMFVANAGIDTPVTSKGQDRMPAARRVFDVNVLAALDGIEFFRRRFESRGAGHLVGISSVAGARGLAGGAAYCATKAALTTYLEALRAEVHGRRIRVSVIAPGFIDTPMTRNNSFPMPFLMPAQTAGETFVAALVRGQEFVIAPWPWRPVYWGLRALPDFIYRAVAKLGGKPAGL